LMSVISKTTENIPAQSAESAKPWNKIKI
jgi:hypothetical protein